MTWLQFGHCGVYEGDCVVHMWYDGAVSCTVAAVVDFCADNPTALAHASPDVQKLLELEQDWGFNVLELELRTKKRQATQS